MKHTLLVVVSFISFLGMSIQAHAQRARVDLDDMMIKGELHNDDRLLILARQKNELKNYVKFRTSYRNEIVQELPESIRGKKF